MRKFLGVLVTIGLIVQLVVLIGDSFLQNEREEIVASLERQMETPEWGWRSDCVDGLPCYGDRR
jgi:hypothetical protein